MTEDMQPMTIRLPRDLHEKLRHEAFETRQSMNELVTIGLHLVLKDDTSAEQYAQMCALFEAAWHHAVPESLDDLPPVTSKEARALALLAEQVLFR
ncbi:MAG TPA: toxin-antitoxin system HicB family antitoxin [Streptosporangiaceae bacterium]|jgi:hypothetical protein